MCALPIERFKEAYKDWRYNPFTGADMAVDKEEDNLFIPGSSPFHIQLVEQPRKNDPTSVTVYCYDDVADFTEVATAPAQSQFRVDYPPDDGEGTGQIEFNNLDAGKEVRINYKATGSPTLAEFLDTKVSYPAGNPADQQILGFVSGAPDWRYNPVCYFHDDNVIYHASGEDESCLLFRFKRSAKQATVILELKGAKLHQGLYTELPSHTHGAGTLAVAADGAHTHGVGTLAVENSAGHTHGVGTLAAASGGSHTHAVGTLAVANESAHAHAFGTLATVAVGDHNHGAGSLSGSQPTHIHGVSGNTANANLAHTHSSGSYGTDQEANHQHGGVENGTGYTGNSGIHSHDVTGDSGAWSIANLHNHSISFNTGAGGGDGVTITGYVADGGGHQHTISGATAAGSAHSHGLTGATASGGSHGHSLTGTSAADGIHNHALSGSTVSAGSHDHGLSGDTASAGTTPKTYPDQLKIYVNSVDKTAEILALTALTEFGDGQGTHAFVTTGSGEMDISSLIAAPGIHELKVTEPISAKGGRCLLHLEVY